MENKKISINMNYVVFVCMCLILMGGYGVVPLNQTQPFNVGAVIVISINNVMMTISALMMSMALKQNSIVRSSQEASKKKDSNPNRAYFWLLTESAFIAAISFSPEYMHFRWIVYLIVFKWVLMFVNNALKIKFIEKQKLP